MDTAVVDGVGEMGPLMEAIGVTLAVSWAGLGVVADGEWVHGS